MSTTAVFVLSVLLAAVCATSQDGADPGPDVSRALPAAPDNGLSLTFLPPKCLVENTFSTVPPQELWDIDIHLHLYKYENATQGWEIDWRGEDDLDLSGTKFDNSWQTIFVTHDLLGNGKDQSMINLKDGLLHQVRGANVFVVDWHRGARLSKHYHNYEQAASNTRVVGEVLAKFVKLLISQHGAKEPAMYGIGFGLGAQVMGILGHAIPKFGRITGLDPASLCFEGLDPQYRLDASDADKVDIVHTSFRRKMWLWRNTTYGYQDEAGKVDIYLNTTSYLGEQPGCDGFGGRALPAKDRHFFDSGECSHEYAHKVFTSSLWLDGYALACKEGYRPVNGQVKDKDVPDECVRFGIDVHFSGDSGTYYLNSTAEYPYLEIDIKPE